jgi:hypothetical protein
LLSGEASCFPFGAQGSGIAVVGEDRVTSTKVCPLDVVLRESEGEADGYGEAMGVVAFSATGTAITAALDLDAALAIAAREGWSEKYEKRCGISAYSRWGEGRQMVEMLTPEKLHEDFGFLV